MASILEVKDVTYYYPRTENSILNNVNLTIEKGEMALLIGPSGCGKTTLALSLNGVIPQKLGGKLEGEITVSGFNPNDHEVAEMAAHISIVFQNPDEQLTCLYVEDEVAFGPENLLLPREEIHNRIDEALEFTGLSEMRNDIVHELSGGQKQRLAIASSLAMKPDVLVLDAPISNIDPIGAAEILPVVDKIRKDSDITVLIIEHVIDDIAPLADRIFVMNERGHIIKSGPTRDILKDGLSLRDDIGLWIPQITELALELEREGVSISGIPLTIEEGVQIMGGVPNIKAFKEKGVPPLPKKLSRISKDTEKVLEIKDLTFVYPTGTLAVEEASFDVHQGEVVAIVGQNGSGKTTTALNLIGILKPTKGQVLVEGVDTRDIAVDKLARKIAYVFQYPEHQFVTDNVRDEIAFGLQNLEMDEEEVNKKVDITLKEMGFSKELETRHPYNLSLGQKRRLSVAVMTVTNPSIIVLDEPTYGQDVKYNDQLMRYIEGLNRAGTTVLFITHSMRTVAKYANTVIAMSNGHIVYDGDPAKFFAQKELLKNIWLRPPPVTELSMNLMKEPILTVSEFKKRLFQVK